MHNTRAEAYSIDERASYKLVSVEDFDVLLWAFAVLPHPFFHKHTLYICYFLGWGDSSRKGWQLFHRRPLRRFVMSMHLEVKWTISPTDCVWSWYQYWVPYTLFWP